jgi:hypothetical protein
VKSQAQRIGESDLSVTRDESALQSPAAEHPDSVRSSRTKKTTAAMAPVDSEHDGHSISGIVDTILEIGRQRNTLLSQLRIALESDKEKEALNLARRLCGLPDE